MKTTFKFIQLLLFTTFLFSVSTVAQSTADTIYMLDGEERAGTVKTMGDDDITFVYEGETLEYKLKRSKIHKIVFASGRTQMINEKAQAATMDNNMSDPAARRNKIAVLPFKIISNMPSVDQDAIGVQIQIDCANELKENAPLMTIVDPRVVNATLAKNGISSSTIDTMLPTELAELLGAEYIVIGSYDIELSGSRSSGSSVTSYKSKKDDGKRKGTSVTSDNSYTTDTYNSKLSIDIYKDGGSNVYSETKKPFMSGLDKYHSTIKYLIKRSPFGPKR